MTPRKLSVFFGFPAFGGSGLSASEHPDIREWMQYLLPKMLKDERIEHIYSKTLNVYPTPLARNMFVALARQHKADVLVMVDNDQSPLMDKGEPGWEEFFESSFDFLYKHYERGPCVIGAPYCCGGAHEEPLIFHWETRVFNGRESTFSLERYSRAQAFEKYGIEEAAALSTGMIMYDMRAFELIEPCKLSRRDILARVASGPKSDKNPDGMTVQEGLQALRTGWFEYEYQDQTGCKIASTEDVQNTRDISLNGLAKLGYNPLYVNWSATIGHHKAKCVAGRPKLLTSAAAGAIFMDANSRQAGDRLRNVDETKKPAAVKPLPEWLPEGVGEPPADNSPIPQNLRGLPAGKFNGTLPPRPDARVFREAIYGGNGNAKEANA